MWVFQNPKLEFNVRIFPKWEVKLPLPTYIYGWLETKLDYHVTIKQPVKCLHIMSLPTMGNVVSYWKSVRVDKKVKECNLSSIFLSQLKKKGWSKWVYLMPGKSCTVLAAVDIILFCNLSSLVLWVFLGALESSSALTLAFLEKEKKKESSSLNSQVEMMINVGQISYKSHE